MKSTVPTQPPLSVIWVSASCTRVMPKSLR